MLSELGVLDGESGEGDIPILEIWNKIDQTTEERAEELRELAAASENAVAISALTGEGVDQLLEAVSTRLTGSAKEISLMIPSSDGKRLAWLHAHPQPAGASTEESVTKAISALHHCH